MKFPKNEINKAIQLSLEHWEDLVLSGPPREIELLKPRCADYVIFTDGSFPDGTPGSPLKPWIGGVIFARDQQPVQFSVEVPMALIEQWIPRKSQIAMVEMFAVIVALKTFEEKLKGSWALLFVDSEPVQGALVKGYSAKEDLCELVGKFWDVAQRLKVYLYIDRVPTDANPSDPPSRDNVKIGEIAGWITTPAVFPF